MRTFNQSKAPAQLVGVVMWWKPLKMAQLTFLIKLSCKLLLLLSMTAYIIFNFIKKIFRLPGKNNEND